MMNELVDVYVRTADKWELLYEDISEDIATEIWRAGFRTGENKISIDDRPNREFFKKEIRRIEALHKH